MLVYIWTRNDGSGILDDEFRDGDIFMVKPDTWEVNVGEQEKKSWLIVKMPDPPNMSAVMEGLVESEYAIGADGFPVVTRARKYRVDWRPKFTAEEVAIIVDATQTLGVVYDRFTVVDCNRKN